VGRTELARTVAADPASVALLLSGPAGGELWSAGSDGEQLQIGPPLRSGLEFAAAVTVRAAQRTVAVGRLVVSPAAAPGECDVRLLLTSARERDPDLARRGRHYLDRLTELAESRSSAA
jgi:hypothetical protein